MILHDLIVFLQVCSTRHPKALVYNIGNDGMELLLLRGVLNIIPVVIISRGMIGIDNI